MRLARTARLVRCAVLAGSGCAGVLELWRIHPAASVRPGPDADIVTGCAWLTWVVAGYLVLAVLLAVLAAAVHVEALARWAPPLVRRTVEVVVSAGLIGALSGAGLPAAAASSGGQPGSSHPHGSPVAGCLDWPGLASADTGHHAPREPGPTSVVVRPGDSLWTIAARHLGPRATAAQIAAAWPLWWDANRDVIGTDPNLIRPGLHLTVPTTRGSQQ